MFSLRAHPLAIHIYALEHRVLDLASHLAVFPLGSSLHLVTLTLQLQKLHQQEVHNHGMADRVQDLLLVFALNAHQMQKPLRWVLV